MVSHTHCARAATVEAPGAPFRLEEVTLEGPGPGEVLVRLVASGMCHTDLNVKLGYYQTHWPMVLGHEGAGIVEASGTGVAGVEAGDHVVLSFAYCGRCAACGDGEPAYCEAFVPLNLSGLRADGSTAMRRGGDPISGHFFGQSSFATHSIVAARHAVPIRRDVPLERMAPLGCGIQTGAGAVINVLQPSPGSRFAVFGAGAVGLSALLAAKSRGVGTTIAVDIRKERLELALELGASAVIDASSIDPVEEIRSLCGGVDGAVEAAGHPGVVAQAAAALAPRGVLAIVGAPAPGSTAAIDVNDLLLHGKTVRGVMEGDSDPRTFIPALIDLYAQGRFPFDRLARIYSFEEIEQAAADCLEGRAVKPLILFEAGK